MDSSASTPRVLQVTRCHCLLSGTFPEKALIQDFVLSTRAQQGQLQGSLVCIGAPTLAILQQMSSHFESAIRELDDSMEVGESPRTTAASTINTIIVLPVFPWGHFTTSLNAAVLYAQDHAFSHILFQVCDNI
jgi:hypothetical protein